MSSQLTNKLTWVWGWRPSHNLWPRVARKFMPTISAPILRVELLEEKIKDANALVKNQIHLKKQNILG